MKANLVRIGNSRVIRIPKTMLEQCQLGDVVELEIRENRLVISRVGQPREGWETAFQRMAKNKDDILLDEGVVTTAWQESEWEW